MEIKPYVRLNFEDYFNICSNNYGNVKVGDDFRAAHYEEVIYKHKGHQHATNYQVRYDTKRDCIQIIFQQTASKSDWKANFEFPHKLYNKFTFQNKEIQLKVHGGWGNMWLACRDKVREKVKTLLGRHKNCYVEIFGWSLGSGLAQIAAEDVYYKFGVMPYLYTFGSVKPFYGRKTYNYVKHCCAAVYNFYDHCDIVGYMVPLPGWHAINHVKVKLERFAPHKLFNPYKFHTRYFVPWLYDEIE